jgi:hypothetical protein
MCQKKVISKKSVENWSFFSSIPNTNLQNLRIQLICTVGRCSLRCRCRGRCKYKYRCMKVHGCVWRFRYKFTRENATCLMDWYTCGEHEGGEVAGPHVGAGTGQVHVHALHLQQLPRHLPPTAVARHVQQVHLPHVKLRQKSSQVQYKLWGTF